MPPKKAKKLTKEEEEEIRLQEEAEKAELARLEQIERSKYEIVDLPNGTKQIFTKYCIENVWEHKKPKEYLKQFLIRQLKTLNTIANFELIDLDIQVEFNLYSLIFAKEDLSLNDEKAVVLLNLMYALYIHNNKRFSIKSNGLGPQEIDAGEYLASLYNKDGIENQDQNELREFTLHADLQFFAQLIKKHACDAQGCTAYFTKSQAKAILQYAQKTYFKHFNLYKHCGEEKQLEQNDVQRIMVDEPQLMDPLGDFEEIIEVKEEEEKEEQEEKKEDDEAKDDDQEQEKEIQQDDFDKLDPEIQKMIEQKIIETEEIMRREVENREKYLEEKLDELLNPKKDKKKK